MAATWDAPTRKKFREYIQLLLALILGAIVLLPTLVGLTKPPFALAWAVPVMLSLASLSVACLGVAMLYVVLGAQAPPFRLIGTGTWAGLAALFLMLVYVVTNVIIDMKSTPVIVALKASPVGVSPGKYVDLDVEATDKSGDKLHYRWVFQGKVISERRNGYLKAPQAAGLYPVSVDVDNGSRRSTGTVQIEVIPEPTSSAGGSHSPSDSSGTKGP